MDLKEFVDRIVADGVLTNAEHEMLMNLIHKDGKIDEEESAQISRIFRLMKAGKLKVVDAEREHYDQIRKAEEAKNAKPEPDKAS